MQHLLEIYKNKQKTEKLFSYPILCPLCNIQQRKNIKTKFTQIRIYLNVSCQVHIIENKGSYKTWKFDCSSTKYRNEMVYQTMHCSKKKKLKSIETEISWVDNEKFQCAWVSNSTWYFIYHWCGIWSKTESAEILLECSMQKLHNELTASIDDGGLLVIISDTMLSFFLLIWPLWPYSISIIGWCGSNPITAVMVSLDSVPFN